MIIFSLFTYNYIIKKFKIIPKFERLIIKSKLLRLLNINFYRDIPRYFHLLFLRILNIKADDIMMHNQKRRNYVFFHKNKKNINGVKNINILLKKSNDKKINYIACCTNVNPD